VQKKRTTTNTTSLGDVFLTTIPTINDPWFNSKLAALIPANFQIKL
jgi:hypothetical protein